MVQLLLRDRLGRNHKVVVSTSTYTIRVCITNKVVSSKPACGEVYSMQHYICHSIELLNFF